MLKTTKLNIWLYDLLNNIVYRAFDLHFNSIIRKQLKDVKSIPVIIINYNQLYYLRQLIKFLLDKNFKNIIIVDNKSSYSPLIQYYDEIRNVVNIEFMDQNYGHSVFFKNRELQKKYGKGFYVLTDADILPNQNLPEDFLEQMIKHLINNWKKITKVGFALRIDDIPKENRLKEKILKWEAKFWVKKILYNVYEAPLDTTFALYKPGYPKKYNQISYLNAHRIAGDFVAKHGGWYIEQNKWTEEQIYYIKTASASSSWLQDEKNMEDHEE